ncbi:hypothetical protein G6011_06052 [Alternaria panax]|uniref:Uncharacterized protein n=1 Tax=Alternaria panax TaxID=48097 RepID=A0AAD4FKR6_9PLEO|nr:hypothetical protein G6011_06052 [Alternaria panax]
MTDRATSPPKRGSPRGAMDPPATPGPGRSARDPVASILTPTPSTPVRRDRTLLPGTPRASNSSFPVRAPRTPGGSRYTACTVDEPQYSRVTVHTAKCTECDKRNMDTMRRCPGCTFQVCQPCYEKRLKKDKGLLHGNMVTPGATGGSLIASGGGRAVRKKPVPSTPGGKSAEKVDEVKEEEEEEAAKVTSKSSAKKRSTKKKAPIVETEAEGSSEDDFELNGASPTPSKRRRTGRRRSELTFAESALATALRTPPATRATRKSLPTPTYQAPPSPDSDPANATTSVGFMQGGFPDNGFKIDQDLYDIGIKPYRDQPLLARREPVMSSPASRIPSIIKRGGKPRAEGQTYRNIQARLRAKMHQKQAQATGQGGTVAPTAEQNKKKKKKKTGQNADPQTVAAFVEEEAAKYQDEVAMDEDENEAIFSAMKSAALVWGKQTYKKLDSETQLMVQPGLKLRLDLIDDMFRKELASLMDEHADRILSELGVGVQEAMVTPPGPLFKPA